ncbi:MAG: SLAP domain-containing protein [Lactobacillus sp.]|nr:SLAP domain-containing protein [Lactobacillus sp.]
MVVNGISYYDIGKGQYLRVSEVDGTTRILKKNAYVYNLYGNRDNKTVLKKGSKIKTFGSVTEIAKNKYYQIGLDKFVKYANFK